MKTREKYIKIWEKGDLVTFVKMYKVGFFGKWKFVLNRNKCPQIYKIIKNQYIAL